MQWRGQCERNDEIYSNQKDSSIDRPRTFTGGIDRCIWHRAEAGCRGNVQYDTSTLLPHRFNLSGFTTISTRSQAFHPAHLGKSIMWGRRKQQQQHTHTTRKQQQHTLHRLSQLVRASIQSYFNLSRFNRSVSHKPFIQIISASRSCGEENNKTHTTIIPISACFYSELGKCNDVLLRSSICINKTSLISCSDIVGHR